MDSERTFRELQEAFTAAWSAHHDGVHEADYVLAGRAVRMRIVGQRLAECVHLPFAHLRTRDAPSSLSQLTIELWDQHETGITCQQGFAQEGDTVQPSLACSQDGRFAISILLHSLSGLDRNMQRIVGCVRGVERLSLYERSRPLHTSLTIWHNDRDVPVIHAGLVSENDQGLLLVGAAGAGKSTTAVTCLCAGLSFLSDDRLGLESAPDGSFVGHSLYGSTTLEAKYLKRFPLLGPHAVASVYPAEDKLLVLLAHVLPRRLARAATIRAVALLRIVDDRHTCIHAATKGEALLALAPSSLLAGPISYGFRGFDKLVQLVERLPCYWLDLGRDLDEIPCRVRELLSEVAS